MYKLSVITVCINAEKTIKNTFESVLSQSKSDFEYIVIDGQSTDGTVKIIYEYKNRFEGKGICVKVISEKDEGIYDAMNKGASSADSEWLIFLNADDQFYSEDTIKTAYEYMDAQFDVIYGDTLCKKGEDEFIYGYEPGIITKKMPFVSQSAFVKTNLQNQYGFNLKYKYGADYELFLRMYLDGRKFKKVDFKFSVFAIGGTSTSNPIECYDEAINIKNDLGIINKNSILQQGKIRVKHLYFRLRNWLKRSKK